MLINSNEKIEDVIKIVKSLEDFDLLIKGVTKTFEKKNQKEWIPWYVIKYIRW